MAIGKSGKYYRSNHIARMMGDAAEDDALNSKKEGVMDKRDSDNDDWGEDGEKFVISKNDDGTYTTSHGGEDRDHDAFSGAVAHAKEAIGDGEEEDDDDEDRVPADKEPKSEGEPKRGIGGLNSLVD
jgi:hypothetical protein